MYDIKTITEIAKENERSGTGVLLADKIAICEVVQLARIADALERLEKKQPQ